MFLLFLVTAVLIIACVIFHASCLQGIGVFMFHGKKYGFPRISIFIILIVLAHLVEIMFFAVTFDILSPYPDYGTISGAEDPTLRDFYYFSATTYTTTGYGDFTPEGNLRILATVEALTGLIMIAWTSSFAFLLMSRYWERRVVQATPPQDPAP
ncbi:MAG: ion channel [Pirellulaceae bacterium]|nr:ion channel [Pirellulaceae bacterium]